MPVSASDCAPFCALTAPVQRHWNTQSAAMVLQVHWQRIILDEGHTLGASLAVTNKLQMACALRAECRWIMTGALMAGPLPGPCTLYRELKGSLMSVTVLRPGSWAQRLARQAQRLAEHVQQGTSGQASLAPLGVSQYPWPPQMLPASQGDIKHGSGPEQGLPRPVAPQCFSRYLTCLDSV